MKNGIRLIKDEFPDVELLAEYPDGRTYISNGVKVFTNLKDEIKFTSVDEMVLEDTLLQDFNNFVKQRNLGIEDDDLEIELE
jgi:hypothetical protein